MVFYAVAICDTDSLYSHDTKKKVNETVTLSRTMSVHTLINDKIK